MFFAVAVSELREGGQGGHAPLSSKKKDGHRMLLAPVMISKTPTLKNHPSLII